MIQFWHASLFEHSSIRTFVYPSIHLPIMLNPAGDLDICASSCRNISNAKNKEGGCNQCTTTKNKISENTG